MIPARDIVCLRAANPSIHHSSPLAGPVKNPKRAIAKVIRVYNRDVGLLTDLVRCTLVCGTVKQAHAFFRKVMDMSVVLGVPGALGEHDDKTGEGAFGAHRKLRITGVKNRFGPNYNAEQSQGYRDLSLQIEVCWVKHAQGIEFLPVSQWGTQRGEKRHICEVQVHLKALLEVKGVGHAQAAKGHQNYQEYRDLMGI